MGFHCVYCIHAILLLFFLTTLFTVNERQFNAFKRIMSSEGKREDVLKAGELDDGGAKTKLAWNILCRRGVVDADAGSAVALLKERVEEGDTEAMWMLGLCYVFGTGIEQDIERGMNLYDQSRESGNKIGSFLALNTNARPGGCLTLTSLCLTSEE